MTACRWTLWRGMCGVLIAYGLAGAAPARANVQTAYGNIWYPSVTSTTDAFYIAVASNHVATAAFGSSYQKTVGADQVTFYVDLALTVTNAAGGTNQLLRPTFGTPLGSVPANVSIGDVIAPPDGYDQTVAPLLDDANVAIWLDYAGILLAADQGAVNVTWTMADGSLNTILYVVSPNPSQRPVRLYWTEGQYSGPTIQFGQNYRATIFYNSQVRYVPGENGVNSNGVWIDTGNNLHAGTDVPSGSRFLLTYSRTAAESGQQMLLGYEVVEVLQPMSSELSANVGDRLLPKSQQFDTSELFNEVTRGVTDQTGQDPENVYVYKHGQGAQRGWIWAIRETPDGEAWRIEVYWKAAEKLGVVWPFEVDIYKTAWSSNAQLHVTCAEASNRVPVLFDDNLGVEILPRQVPAGHASLDGGKRFTASGEGFSLLKYLDGEKVWFEPIRSVFRTNSLASGGSRNWDIGTELRAFGGADVYTNWPGYLYQPAGTRYLTTLYDYPASYAAAAASASYLYGVNTGSLEAWWFNASHLATNEIPFTKPVYWPSLVCRYANVYPTNAPQLVIASGLGSRGASLLGPSGCLTIRSTAVLSVGDLGLGSNQDFTVEAWIRPTNALAGATNVLFDGGTGWPMVMLSNGYLVARTTIGRTSYGATSAAALPTGAWSHVAATFTHGTPSAIALYVDGTAAGSQALVWSSPTTPMNLRIGGATNNTRNFAGSLDEIRVWNTARDAAAIQLGRWTVNDPADPTLLLWYDCETNHLSYGIRLVDGSLNANDANFVFSGPSSSIVVTPGGAQRAQLGRDYAGTSAQVYYQNSATNAGYNPNEEHALIQGDAVYALRNDLNVTNGTAFSSDPLVLVVYNNLDEGRPGVDAYRVLATNEFYAFERALTAGLMIQAPSPLNSMQPSYMSNNLITGTHFRDRNQRDWASQAGNDGGTSNLLLQFYYPNQPGFYFPGTNAQPAMLNPIQWLKDPAAPSKPVKWTYRITWPEDVPEMYVAQTLTKPREDLPAIRGQLSVDVVYQQSVPVANKPSVALYDPTVARKTEMYPLPAGMKTTRDPGTGHTLFNDLPPSLSTRLYFNATDTSNEFQLVGQFKERIDGYDYLLLNTLTGDNRSQCLDVTRVRGQDAVWSNAIDRLPTEIVTIEPNVPYDSAALNAGGKGAGYVTVLFNNSTNRGMVDPSEVVTMNILRVIPELYVGKLALILSANPLDKQLTLHYTADYGGHPENYFFEWQHSEPIAGLASTNEADWSPLPGSSTGANYRVIGDAGIFGLSDHYIRCRYRALDPEVVALVGTNFTRYAEPALAEGWVKRVLKAINPYDQRFADLMNHDVNTQLSIVQQIGPPYNGQIPLNIEALDQNGLLAIYRTIMEEARNLSIDANIDGGVNVALALMMAAGRINDLNMVLGNEAYADALDPTIGIGTENALYGAYASSLFSFKNQAPTLLEEELALLRGRESGLNPQVADYPVFNRLPWNFTADIVGGQPAYVLNYGISDVNTNGFLDVGDAYSLFPQGHGDAYGYYLSALKSYYQLLHETYFSWMPQAEGILAGIAQVGDVPGYDLNITVSFLHEKKIAVAAAAKAKAAVGILERTYQNLYTGDEAKPWTCQQDSTTNRAWGVGEWGARAGMGSYFDWLTANALLPDRDQNSADLGIQIIDRGTVPELAEIPQSFQKMQEVVDRADTALNPLGLAAGAVPFDISAADVDAGKTHFEQAYAKALAVLREAVGVFDRVQAAGQALREQNANGDIQETVQKEEAAINRELVEIYGYPYADDIGPGRIYPQGYNGPDLLHYMYLDLFGADPTGQTITYDIMNYAYDGVTEANYGTMGVDSYYDWVANARYNYLVPNVSATTTTVSVYVTPGGISGKPDSYVGQRRASGEIQIALAEFIQSIENLNSWVANAQASSDAVRKKADELRSKLDAQITISRLTLSQNSIVAVMQGVLDGIDLYEAILEAQDTTAAEAQNAAIACLPAIVGMAIDPSPAGRAAIKAIYAVKKASADVEKIFAEQVKFAVKESMQAVQQALGDAVAGLQLSADKRQAFYEMIDTLDNQSLQSDGYAQMQAFSAAGMRYMQLIARGDALQVEREKLRMNWSSDLSAKRYRNMAYRIFRDDQLARYQQVFDNAARYVYLAAKAYDYETGLLASDAQHVAGRDFMNQIAKSRMLGAVSASGQPLVGGSIGEPGLADVMARMNANWDVLKGRLNFNNPDTETGRFSLRTELFRILASTNSDKAWRDMLEAHVVDNLLDVPEFKRYCLPFNPAETNEPAIVIPFTTTIDFRKNFFGHALAGGDNAYDSTHFSTKIRSAGVWFSNYTNIYNVGTSGGGLANQPRVYLIPAGIDRMRVPDGTSETIRDWSVVDQALPVPYPINDLDWLDPDWSALKDLLGGQMFNLRKHGSLRAYHDSGTWDASQVSNNARLIGRSVWNSRWILVIPGGTLLSDADLGIDRFIHGSQISNGVWDENGVKDIKLIFQTYSYAGN